MKGILDVACAVWMCFVSLTMSLFQGRGEGLPKLRPVPLFHCIRRNELKWFLFFIRMPFCREIPNYRSSWKITPGRHSKDYITSLMWECLGIHQEELESVARAMSGILCFTCNCYNDPDTLGKMDGWICLPLFPSLHFQTSIWGTVQTFKNCGVNWEKHIYRPETGIPIAFIE